MQLMRKLLKKQGFAPDVLETDKLRSYRAAKSEIGCRLATTGACARTIGLRIRINRHDGASARCSVSNRPEQPSASCQFTPPSSTPSTSSVISASAPASKRWAPSAIAQRAAAVVASEAPQQERPLDLILLIWIRRTQVRSAGTGGNDLVGAIIEIGRDKGINLRRSLTSASVWAKCETCGHQAGVNVDVLAETLVAL